VKQLLEKYFSIKRLSIVIALTLVIAITYIWPWGMPTADRYFDPIGERQLQADEIGQLRTNIDRYLVMSLSGDTFKGWNTEYQSFWKYAISFAAYGMPSAMLIDPENAGQYKVTMDNMIWKMKSKKVWHDFTSNGFGPDPISVQNIMYKGHLNLMYALFQLSTGDLRYSKEFTWLSKQIIEEMNLHHEGFYEGNTCEPNAWFVECNVIGMLSLHIYDKMYGTEYTKNQVQWSVDFIMERMRDKGTGLFYRAYIPNHDVVMPQIKGYTNAWVLSFMNVFVPEEMKKSYPSFKEHLTLEYGPYAAARLALNHEEDQIAQIFALWAAKEFGDVSLFSKLRNAADKFGKLDVSPATGGLEYQGINDSIINGVILGSKLHVGWNTLLTHDWGHKGIPYDVPDTSKMEWTDLLPNEVYDKSAGILELPKHSNDRACPGCFWGDYKSVRMLKDEQPDSKQAICPAHVKSGSCGLSKLDNMKLIN
jgi:hypothetical protein